MVQSHIDAFIRNGTLPDLSQLTRAELEYLLIDVETVKRNASRMLRSTVTKAAASQMVARCQDAVERISAAHRKLTR